MPRMSAPPDKSAITVCQICAGTVNRPYYWNDDPRLPMHKDTRQCTDSNPQRFADFLNRNVEYINGRGEPALLATATI